MFSSIHRSQIMTKFSSNIIHIHSECPINDEYFWNDAKVHHFSAFQIYGLLESFEESRDKIYINTYFRVFTLI